MPGVVFSGSNDGGLRAYDSATGKVIWTFDTNPAFNTINGITANGGPFGRPGNVLLVFGVE